MIEINQLRLPATLHSVAQVHPKRPVVQLTIFYWDFHLFRDCRLYRFWSEQLRLPSLMPRQNTSRRVR